MHNPFPSFLTPPHLTPLSTLFSTVPWKRKGQDSQSQQPNPLPSLPSLPPLQPSPLTHTPRLHTHHPPPPILGPKIRHPARLVRPRVPHHHVPQLIALDLVPSLLGLGDGDGLGGVGAVDAVGFGGEGEWGLGGRSGGVVLGLVDEGGGFEAGDCEFGDILITKGVSSCLDGGVSV